jgi:hypothetical protein
MARMTRREKTRVRRFPLRESGQTPFLPSGSSDAPSAATGRWYEKPLTSLSTETKNTATLSTHFSGGVF